MNSDNGKGDDLTVIKGIGPARQRLFKESLNVCTFRVLAAFSVDEIESRLKAEGQIVSRDEIKHWIDGAKELAAIDLTSKQNLETAKVDTIARPEPPFPLAKWNSIAAFVVHLQIREIEGNDNDQRITVQHIPVAENGTWLEEDIGDKPVEIEGEHQGEILYKWMYEQVAEKIPEVPASGEKIRVITRTTETPIQEEQPVNVDITQFRVFQPPQVAESLGIGKAGEIFSGFITENQPFNFEISFELSGAGASDTTLKETEYRVRCYAYNRSTGKRIHLGDLRPGFLIKTKLDYTATLTEVTLPMGLHRLHVIAELMGTPGILGYLEVPVLQVVEVSAPHWAKTPMLQV